MKVELENIVELDQVQAEKGHAAQNEFFRARNPKELDENESDDKSEIDKGIKGFLQTLKVFDLQSDGLIVKQVDN